MGVRGFAGMCGFESSDRDIRAHRDEPETARDVVFPTSYNVAFPPHCAISRRETPSGGKAMHGRAPPDSLDWIQLESRKIQ